AGELLALRRALPARLLLSCRLSRLPLLSRYRACERRDNLQRLIGCALTRFPGAADCAPQRFVRRLARIKDAIAQRFADQDAARRLAAGRGCRKRTLDMGCERPLRRVRTPDCL